jgi:glycosyltransferase involved in cell wall biosynthesis
MLKSQSITIVIPTKNEENYLPSLLLSLKNQRYVSLSDFQIILADANSNDKTKSIFECFCKENGVKSKIISGGLPAVARNNGAKKATTSHVMFLDADTILADTFLWQSQKAISAKNLSIYSPIFKDQKGQIGTSLLWAWVNFLVQSQITGNCIAGLAMLVNREDFLRVGGFEDRPGDLDDVQLARKFSKNQFGYINDYAYASDRRFKRDGLGKVFLTTSKFYYKSYRTGQYKFQVTEGYFDKSY